MKRLLLSIFSIFLIQAAYSQEDAITVEETGDSLAVMAVPKTIDADTTPVNKARFFQPTLSFDYGKLATTLAGFDKKYEVGGSFLFLEQYLLVGELGSAILEPENAFKNGIYQSEGWYYRLGGGYTNQINLTSKLGIGALYAVSNFHHNGQVFLRSNIDVQEDIIRQFEASGLEARWLELFITSESWLKLSKENPQARINKLFALGFQIRFRFLTSRDRFPLFDVYAIPGYGRAVNDPQLAVNLFLKFYPFGK